MLTACYGQLNSMQVIKTQLWSSSLLINKEITRLKNDHVMHKTYFS